MAEGTHERIVAIQIHNRTFLDVAHVLGHKPGGRDIPKIRHEHDAVAVTHAKGASKLRCPDLLMTHTLGGHPLGGNAAVVKRLGGAHLERFDRVELVRPLQQLFSLARINLREHEATARANEEEQGPPHDFMLLEELADSL